MNDYLNIPLPASDGQTYALKDFAGKKLIVYFYPKDNTSGCTIQAKDFSHYQDAFAAKGYTIIGVSRDSLKSHHNFIEKQDLSILLLSDPEQKLIQAFDVIKEKSMYGKKYLGVDRSTFVLDEDGKIIQSLRGVKAKGHAEMLLESL